jgi:hypothetical protein
MTDDEAHLELMSQSWKDNRWATSHFVKAIPVTPSSLTKNYRLFETFSTGTGARLQDILHNDAGLYEDSVDDKFKNQILRDFCIPAADGEQALSKALRCIVSAHDDITLMIFYFVFGSGGIWFVTGAFVAQISDGLAVSNKQLRALYQEVAAGGFALTEY